LEAIFDTKCNNRVFHQKYNFNTLKNEESYTFLSIVNYYQLSNNDTILQLNIFPNICLHRRFWEHDDRKKNV